ncbi:MAG: tetratricopeptide repeat protein [Planctomycetota bacterium]|jgi:Tfp pilus assembly protein PilF
MQTLPTQQTTGDRGITGSSGFSPIPTRIKDLPPLIIEPDDHVMQQVQQQIGGTLEDLGIKLAAIHNTAAEGWLSQGNYEKALLHMAAAVSMVPSNVDYLHQYGVVCYLTGEDDRAIECFTTLLQTQPTNPDTLFNLGMVLFGKEKFAEAEECFRRSLEADPNHAECWNNRGVCLFKQGRVEEGRNCFQKALSLEPENEDARFNLEQTGS